MNNIDFSQSKFDSDAYGNLYPKAKPKTPKKYKGFTLDVGFGHVKVWDESDVFFGTYPDAETAKKAIDWRPKLK